MNRCWPAALAQPGCGTVLLAGNVDRIMRDVLSIEGHYSIRSAVVGSSRVARRAGTMDATSATVASKATVRDKR